MGYGIEFEGRIIHAGFDTRKDAERWLKYFKRMVKVMKDD